MSQYLLKSLLMKNSTLEHIPHVCDKVQACLFSMHTCACSNFDVPASQVKEFFNGAIIPKLLYGLLARHLVLRLKGPLQEIFKVFVWFAALIAFNKMRSYFYNEESKHKGKRFVKYQA